MLYSYKINYFLCFLSAIFTLMSAAMHDLLFVVINFACTVLNWYLAEYKRGLENETTKDPGTDNDDKTEE